MKIKSIEIFNLLDDKTKRKLINLFFVIFFGLLLEVVGIGIVYPLIIYLLEPKSFNFISDRVILLGSVDEKVLANFLLYSVAIIYLLRTFILFYLNFYKNKLLSSITTYFTVDLFVKYLNLPYLRFKEKDSSYYITNLNTEVNHMLMLINAKITLYMEALLAFIVVLTVALIEPVSTVISFSFLTISFLVFNLFIKNRINRLGKEREVLFKNFNKQLIESFKGFELIKSYRKDKEFVSMLKKTSVEENQIKALSNSYKETPRYFVELNGIIAVVLFISILKFQNVENIEIVGYLGVLTIGIFRLLPSLNKILVSLNSIKFYESSTRKIIDELNKFKKTQRLDFIDFENIELKNVSLKIESDTILSNINLKIKKGQKLSIQGKSGSGKTSLINLITGLYKIEHGEKLVNGKIFNDDFLPFRYSLVSQNNFIFNQSVEFNITLKDKDIDKNFLFDCLKKVELYDKVVSLKNKEKTKLGELGNIFSGGQIQRISIARALYQKSDLLILDEPSSALDKYTSLSIFKKLLSDKKLTVLLVTHDEELVKLCGFRHKLDNKQLKYLK